jgi:hypothetical protein
MKMNWREINEKYMQLQADGKSAQEAAEMLRDEIGEIAKECASNPKRMAEIMSELKEGNGLGHNPAFTALLFSFLFRARDGWG